jgi:hypothetical protein
LYSLIFKILDDKFLLQFLRTKKFDLEKSKELFEKYLLLKSEFPKWFEYSNAEAEELKMWELFDSSFIVPLIERDSDGRQVILIQAEKLNPKSKEFTFAHILRLTTRIAQVLLEDEMTQINGFVVLVLLKNITLSHLTLFPLTDIIDFVKIVRTCAVGRHKEMHIIGLPHYATFMLEVAKKVMSEKLRNRIKLHDNLHELQKEMDLSMMPLEYAEFNGKFSESKMMDKFRQLYESEKNKIQEIEDGVDFDKVALEIDTRSSCSLM